MIKFRIHPLTTFNFPLLTVCMIVTSSVGDLIIMRANYIAHLDLAYLCTPVRVGKPVSLVVV